MKATGIVRKIDELGRVTLPIETRRILNINEKDPVEIYTDGDSIVLKKYQESCSICGNKELEGSEKFKEKVVCKDCLKELRG